MTTPASRQTTVYPEQSAYLSSESGQSDWAQPAASHYRFSIVDNRLVGIQLGTSDAGISQEFLNTPLEDELLAWDAASDEAWLNFDSKLD